VSDDIHASLEEGGEQEGNKYAVIDEQVSALEGREGASEDSRDDKDFEEVALPVVEPVWLVCRSLEFLLSAWTCGFA
jgi:hypothetical protein